MIPVSVTQIGKHHGWLSRNLWTDYSFHVTSFVDLAELQVVPSVTYKFKQGSRAVFLRNGSPRGETTLFRCIVSGSFLHGQRKETVSSLADSGIHSSSRSPSIKIFHIEPRPAEIRAHIPLGSPCSRTIDKCKVQ